MAHIWAYSVGFLVALLNLFGLGGGAKPQMRGHSTREFKFETKIQNSSGHSMQELTSRAHFARMQNAPSESSLHIFKISIRLEKIKANNDSHNGQSIHLMAPVQNMMVSKSSQ